MILQTLSLVIIGGMIKNLKTISNKLHPIKLSMLVVIFGEEEHLVEANFILIKLLIKSKSLINLTSLILFLLYSDLGIHIKKEGKTIMPI